MKIEIKLVDDKKSALKNAELIITLVMKNGRQRVLPSRTSNVRGEIPEISLEPNMFKAIDFAQSRYQITVGDRGTPEMQLGQPAKVSAKRFRYVLVAHQLSSGDPSTPTLHALTRLRAIFETKRGKRMAGSKASLTFSSTDRTSYNLGPVGVDESGVAQFQLPVSAEAIDWQSLAFSTEMADLAFSSIDVGVPERSENVWHILVVMQRENAPQPNPKPPNNPQDRDGDGESTQPKGTAWVVQGVVTGNGGIPEAGVQVEVFYKPLFRTEKMGEAITATDGRYRIDYHPDKYMKTGERKPSILLKALRGKQVLATSGLIAKAGPIERVDFAISAEPFNMVPLYIQIRNDTDRFLDGGSPVLFGLEDVALLADKTNHNPVALACYVRAWDLIEKMNSGAVEAELAEAFFGLASGGGVALLGWVAGHRQRQNPVNSGRRHRGQLDQ